MFLIDAHKPPQGSYAEFAHGRPHADEQIQRAQRYIESEGAAALSVERIAARIAMTRRTLIRRFKAATGVSPLEYLQRARIEQARRLLQSTSRSMTDIALEVGYHEQAAFRRLFVRHTGLTPSEYRKRHGA